MIDSRTAPYAAFVLRIALGVMFVAHSVGLKAVGFTLPGTAGFFRSLGLPAALAYAVFAMEADPLGGAGARADPARRDLGARRQRMALFGAEGRLGISCLPDGRGARPGAARRRRLRAVGARRVGPRTTSNCVTFQRSRR